MGEAASSRAPAATLGCRLKNRVAYGPSDAPVKVMQSAHKARRKNAGMAEATPYDLAFRRQLDTYQPDLWHHLELVPQLPPETSAELLSYLLDLACRAQHVRNIELGRTALLALPRAWLLKSMPSIYPIW